MWKRYVHQMSLCIHISVPYTFDIYPLRICHTYSCTQYVYQIYMKQRFDVLFIYIETFSIRISVPYTFDIHTPRIWCTSRNLMITDFFFTYLLLFYLPWRPLPHHAGHQKKTTLWALTSWFTYETWKMYVSLKQTFYIRLFKTDVFSHTSL